MLDNQRRNERADHAPRVRAREVTGRLSRKMAWLGTDRDTDRWREINGQKAHDSRFRMRCCRRVIDHRPMAKTRLWLARTRSRRALITRLRRGGLAAVISGARRRTAIAGSGFRCADQATKRAGQQYCHQNVNRCCAHPLGTLAVAASLYATISFGRSGSKCAFPLVDPQAAELGELGWALAAYRAESRGYHISQSEPISHELDVFTLATWSNPIAMPWYSSHCMAGSVSFSDSANASSGPWAIT